MKKTTNLIMITGAILSVTTMAFALNATGTANTTGMMNTTMMASTTTGTSSYSTMLSNARGTLKTDNAQLKADRLALKTFTKAKDGAGIADTKDKIAQDKLKIKADTKVIDDMRAAHKKELGMTNDGKIDKKDKNGKDMETNDDKKMGTGTKATSSSIR